MTRFTVPFIWLLPFFTHFANPNPLGIANSASVTLVHEFYKGSWIENIAVRSNGHLLFTFLDKPEVWELDPLTKDAKPSLAYRFPSSNGCLGITEIKPDKFAVIVGQNNSVMGIGGSYYVWTLDLQGNNVNAEQVTRQKVPASSLLNGLTTLSSDAVLASDSAVGGIYRIDLKTGESVVVLNDTTMDGFGVAGVNGIRLRGQMLYYSNTVQGLLARIPISLSTGKATGPAEVLVSNHVGTDDFALDAKGEAAYVVNNFGDYLYRVDFASKRSTNLTTDPLVKGATSAQFGRAKGDETTLYVTTNGGTESSTLKTASGKIVAVKVL
jgi:hypothetical protein